MLICDRKFHAVLLRQSSEKERKILKKKKKKKKKKKIEKYSQKNMRIVYNSCVCVHMCRLYLRIIVCGHISEF